MHDPNGMLTAGDMPENLFRRTRHLDQGGTTEDRLLQRCTVSPTDLPDLDAESGGQPRIPEVPASKKKRRPGRNSVFDDTPRRPE
ncbi:hypothetical protein [Streptomyces sp. NPDC007083]|uniref:hypothetical protein n=1 Tax=Streptomyces sp. NPDC007083 TaxID=3156913 RepID=UPI0033D61827